MNVIDVILPFHSDDDFLVSAIQSIQNQINCETRLIVVDDRESEGPLKAKMPKNTVQLISGGVGYSEALKLGLKSVENPLVAFQDSDDFSDPRRLDKQRKKLIEENADLIYCGMRHVNKNGLKARLRKPVPSGSKYSKEALLLGSFGANSTWVMKSEILEGFFQFDYQAIDWASAITAFPRIRVSSVDEELYLYRSHSGQMTRKSSYVEKVFDQIYPLWLELNLKLGLPHLSKSDAATIAFPISGRKMSPEVMYWVEEFLARVDEFDEVQRLEFKQIIGQRFLQNLRFFGFSRTLLKNSNFVWKFIYFQTKIQPSG